jgi:hypothetical protein
MSIPPFVGNAGAPFHREDADIVLRSEDGIDFRTIKAVLSSASEVFDHMFSSPSANMEELSDGLAIVPLYDPSPVLKGLLCYCDPDIDSRLCSVRLIDVQQLAVKYDMLSVAKAVYRDRSLLEREPLPSHMLDMIREKFRQDHEDMFLAATNIFTAFEEDEEEEMVDIGLVSKAQLDALKRYRGDCRTAAVAVARPQYSHFTWMDPTYNWFRSDVAHTTGRTCNMAGGIFIASVTGKMMTRYWWRSYIDAAVYRLEKRPWGSTVTSGDFFDTALKEASCCDVCGHDLDYDFRYFTEIFAAEIDSAVSQARYHVFLSGDVTDPQLFDIGSCFIMNLVSHCAPCPWFVGLLYTTLVFFPSHLKGC